MGALKVIQGYRGRYQSKARLRLSVDSNEHPISYRFGVFAAYCSNIGHSYGRISLHRSTKFHPSQTTPTKL